MEYRVKFKDDIGNEIISMPFETEEEAEQIISEDMEKFKKCYRFSNYECKEFENKTTFRIKDKGLYVSWERLWK